MAAAKKATKEGVVHVKDSAIGMTVYLMPDDHRRLKIIAATEDTSIQSLVMDAIDALIALRGEPPVQRWQPRRHAR
jgi:hypothetical protein